MTDPLLRALAADFDADVYPALGSDQRYSGAMMKRALAILIREHEAVETPGQTLAKALGPATTPRTLADQIRGRHNDLPDDQALRAALTAYVRAKLEINNPAFLVPK